MLVVIMSIFLITELPQGVVTLLSGLLHSSFYDHVYTSLGDLLDLLSLLNSLVTFILYVSMSGLYRKEFNGTFIMNTYVGITKMLIVSGIRTPSTSRTNHTEIRCRSSARPHASDCHVVHDTEGMGIAKGEDTLLLQHLTMVHGRI